MTSNDGTNRKNELTISVVDAGGQRRDVTFEIPLHQGKKASELTLGEVIPPDLLAQLESMPVVMPGGEEEMWKGQSPGLDVANPTADNLPLSSPPISEADLRAVHEHTAKHCPLCGQLIPGNTEGATDVSN